MKKKPPVTQTITNSPGAVQAGRDLNITDIPAPKFSMVSVKEHEPIAGVMYRSHVIFTINSKAPLAVLRLRAYCQDVVSIEAQTRLSTVSVSGYTGVLETEGFAFTEVPNANGPYDVYIITRRPGKCEIIYDYD
jgi:hypothetical protein